MLQPWKNSFTYFYFLFCVPDVNFSPLVLKMVLNIDIVRVIVTKYHDSTGIYTEIMYYQSM